MSYRQDNNFESIYPTLPSPTRLNTNQVYPQYQNQPQVFNPIKPPKKKTSKCKIVCIVCIVLVVLAILVVVAVILGVFLSKNSNCRYGSENGKCIECGVSYYGNKIVGGQEATSHSWPSIVYLRFKYTFEYGGLWYQSTASCGGTLVNRDTVVTAAHCYMRSITLSGGITYTVVTNSVHQTFESMYTVYAGLHSKASLSSGVALGVKSFTLHPSYSTSSYLNDIAIIKLNQSVTLNNNVQISCIPESTNIYPNKSDISAYIVGWGYTDSAGTISPDNLQEALITVYDSSKCSLVSAGSTKNWDSQICAGKYSGGVDSCQGDSGGPLYVKDSVDGKQKYILSGVTSYGDGCALATKPGIYTRVSYYVTWIEKYMSS